MDYPVLVEAYLVPSSDRTELEQEFRVVLVHHPKPSELSCKAPSFDSAHANMQSVFSALYLYFVCGK
jgi:hypothetical protein